MRWTSIMVVAALLVITHGSSAARTYVVSTTGNDNNAGTLAAPWRTLGRAGSGLQAGDTVLVRAGVYHERFVPSNGGSPGNPIVYKNYPGEQPEIDGSPSGEINVLAIYQNYVAFEGFLITNQNYFKTLGDPTYWVTLDGNYLTFRYNHVIAYGDVFDNIYVKNAISRGIAVGGNHSVIEHCFVRGQVFGIVLTGPSPRNLVVRYDTVHATGQNNIDNQSTSDGGTAYHATLIEYCQLDTSFIEDNIQFEIDYNDPTSTLHNRGTIIRYTRFGNAAENAIDLKGAGHTIIEHNLIYGSSGDDDGPIGGHDVASGGGVTSNSNNPTRNTIIRYNVIWDHSTGMEMAEGDHYFNNTILNNRHTWEGPNQPGGNFVGVRAWILPNANRSLLNNIIGAQPNLAVYDWLMDWGDKFEVNYNLYYDNGALTKFYHRMNGNRVMTEGLPAWKSALASYGGYAFIKGKDAASIEANPSFVNVPAYPAGYDPSWDFGLAAGSPAIDAGGPLTTATSAGNGATTLTVADAYFFCDGFNTVEGDSIRIGGGAPVRITSIDYTNNVITLNEARSWAAGAAVTMNYNGTAPDIGAKEFGTASTTSPPPVVPPSPAVQLNLPVDGATSVVLNPTITWATVATAQTYQVQVSLASSFGTTLVDVSGLTGNTYPVTSLAANTVYYWRVRAANSGGTGAWSVIRSFTTVAAPVVVPPSTAVQLSVPADGATNVALASALTWGTITTAQTYQVQISLASTFATTVVDVNGLTGSTYTLISLTGNTVYYWRVRGVNQGGNGPWSTVRSFSTVPGTDVTSAQAVRNNDFENGTQDWTFVSGGGTGSFTTASPGYTGLLAARVNITTVSNNIQLYESGITLAPAASYQLTFSAYSNTGHGLAVGVLQHVSPFANYGLPARNIPLSKGWRTRTIYFQTKNFTATVNDARLQFAFQAYAAPGDQYWLDGISLQRVSAVPVPPTPSLIGPASGSADVPTRIALQWNDVDAADSYQVQIATDSGFAAAVYDTLVTDTLVQSAPLLNGTRYFCRVRANNIGGAGAFSNIATFTTVAKEQNPGKQSEVPQEIQLDQNYPNPFNPATLIRYRLTGSTHVNLVVYNTLGAVVAVLANGVQEKGEYAVEFKAQGLPSGVYFCRLHAEGVIETRKMILMR